MPKFRTLKVCARHGTPECDICEAREFDDESFSEWEQDMAALDQEEWLSQREAEAEAEETTLFDSLQSTVFFAELEGTSLDFIREVTNSDYDQMQALLRDAFAFGITEMYGGKITVRDVGGASKTGRIRESRAEALTDSKPSLPSSSVATAAEVRARAAGAGGASNGTVVVVKKAKPEPKYDTVTSLEDRIARPPEPEPSIPAAITPEQLLQPGAVVDVLDMPPKRSEVAKRILKGESNAEIAAGMQLAPKTVESHITKIGSTLPDGYAGREGLVRFSNDVLLAARRSVGEPISAA